MTQIASIIEIHQGLQIGWFDERGVDVIVSLYRDASGYRAEWGLNHAWDDHPIHFDDLETAIRAALATTPAE